MLRTAAAHAGVLLLLLGTGSCDLGEARGLGRHSAGFVGPNPIAVARRVGSGGSPLLGGLGAAQQRRMGIDRGAARLRCALGDGDRERVSETVNDMLYKELREREAVQHPGAGMGTETLLPSPDMSPQQVITAVLKAMKESPKRGCRVALRFMSDQNEHGHMTPSDYEEMLRIQGQPAVVLGNFRSFKFPTPTFEATEAALGAPSGQEKGAAGGKPAGDAGEGGELGRSVAVQEVQLFVPGFLAARFGASRGWDVTARLRWQLSRGPGGCWMTDGVDILPPRGDCDGPLSP